MGAGPVKRVVSYAGRLVVNPPGPAAVADAPSSVPVAKPGIPVYTVTCDKAEGRKGSRKGRVREVPILMMNRVFQVL